MGAWGSGLFDNDNALDVMGDLEDSTPQGRPDLVVAALDEVLLADGYIEAPEMSAAVAAAAAVGAVVNPGAAVEESSRPHWLAADAFEVDEELIEKSRRVLRRAIRAQDNELLAKDPKDRYQTADEMVASCQRALAWLGDRDD